MKTIVFLGLLAVALAAPQGEENAQIVKQEAEINPDGSYRYSYETSNGISADESGALKDIGAENPALQVEGQSSYPGENGETVRLQYIANENGYQPQGSHLPTPPPIPAAIARALEYLATAPPQPEN